MRSVAEASSGYLGTRRSPAGIGGAVAVHVLAAGIVLLMPREMIDEVVPPILRTYAVPADSPPPDPVPERAERKSLQPLQRHDEAGPALSDVTPSQRPADDLSTLPGDPGTIGAGAGGTTADPPRPVLLVDALPDPRYAHDFQPPYPPAMQRLQEEGKVTVRLRIGTDGRVLAVEKLFATNDVFWKATERQALRRWRFLPATRDGIPMEGVRVITLRFQLT